MEHSFDDLPLGVDDWSESIQSLADIIDDTVTNDDIDEALDQWIGLDPGVADSTWDVAFKLPLGIGFRVIINAPGTKYDQLIGYQVGSAQDGLATVRLNDRSVTKRSRLIRLPVDMTMIWLGEQHLSDFQEAQIRGLYDSFSIDAEVQAQLHTFGAREKTGSVETKDDAPQGEL